MVASVATIETRLPPDPAAPRAVLVAGEGACPPEDCGGVYGYSNLLSDLQDPAAEGYEDAREWLGEDFDPNHFDLAQHACPCGRGGGRLTATG